MIGTLLIYIGTITFLFSFLTANVSTHINRAKSFSATEPVAKKHVWKIHLEYCGIWVAFAETLIGICLDLSSSDLLEKELTSYPIPLFFAGLLASYFLTRIISESTLGWYVRKVNSIDPQPLENWIMDVNHVNEDPPD